MIDLDKVRKIYFIGIGGVGMSAAAGMAAEQNFEISGSDSRELYDPTKSMLERFGIEYHVGYEAVQAKEANADLYIASSGENESNPEVKYLVDQDIPIYSFSELLYELNKEKLRIVVAGTHGKSTTAGLLGHILHNIDDSSFMTGAVLQRYETNFETGTGHYAVFEGDEYKALYDDPTPKFHLYKPDILILTNLEYDHPDLFANFGQMKDEFQELIMGLPDDGLIIYNGDDPNLMQLVHQSNVASFSFGIRNPADYHASDIVYDETGTSFSVNRINKGELLWQESYHTQLAGEINVYNALACIALLRALGFEAQLVQTELDTYEGVKRRFEKLGQTPNGAVIYDDYAHHPTAVRETLTAARQRYPDKTIWAVFEPHTFSRTKATLDELVSSFEHADKVLIAEIYPAREQRTTATITGKEVVAAIAKHHKDVRLVENKQAAIDTLRQELHPGDVVIIMAVGSFNVLGKELLV